MAYVHINVIILYYITVLLKITYKPTVSWLVFVYMLLYGNNINHYKKCVKESIKSSDPVSLFLGIEKLIFEISI